MQSMIGVIALGKSHALAAWLIVASLGAAILVLLYLPPLAAAGAGCLVLLHAGRELRLHALRRHPQALTALQYGNSGLALQLRSGAWHDATLLSGSLVTRWLTVARLQEADNPSRRRVLVLCADSVDAEDYRRLRVYLRWCWRDPKADAAELKA